MVIVIIYQLCKYKERWGLAVLALSWLVLAGCGSQEATPPPAVKTTLTADATIMAATHLIDKVMADSHTAAVTVTPGAALAPVTHTATPTPNAALTEVAMQQQVATSVAATIMAAPSATAGATATLLPTSTPEPTATIPFVPSATSTMLPASLPATFHPVSLRAAANASTEEGYVNPPLGFVQLGSVDFVLPQGRNSITTQAEPLPDYPTNVLLEVEHVTGVRAVYLLLTGGITRKETINVPIGQVVLHFQQEIYAVALIPGYNLREWKIYGDQNVTTFTDRNMQEVWRTANTHDDGVGIIDMLTVPVPARLQNYVLVAVEIVDQSQLATGSLNPAINILGVTVFGQ